MLIPHWHVLEGNVQASKELSLDYPITQDHPFKVCIIGPTGVGKTTLKHNLMSSKLEYQGKILNLKLVKIYNVSLRPNGGQCCGDARRTRESNSFLRKTLRGYGE